MTLFNQLQNLMIKYRFWPNKRIAQHFVVDQRLIEKLVGLTELEESDTVLEIGPGTGFLTKELLKKCKVVAVEIDEKLCQLLQEELPGKNLRLVCADFLKIELPRFNKVVSLPPYSQSRAIMYKLLECQFELAVLVFQKQFAEKLVAQPGFEEYCALSVLSQHAFESKAVETVSHASFFPKPKEESCIVKLKAHKRFASVQDKAAFSFFVKTLFRFQNKNLKNALAKSQQFLLPRLKIPEAIFKEKMPTLPSLEKKVNLISVQEFVEIFNCLTN